MSGRSAAYPASKYLSGTGVANNAQVARTRALSNLTTGFELELTTATERGGSNRLAASRYANLASVRTIIQGESSRMVRGIRVADTWENPETHVAHALAVLSRKQAAANLRSEIQRMDDMINTYLQRSHTDSDVLHKIRDAQLALNSQVARGAYERSLRVVDVDGQGVAPRWEIQTLDDNLEGLFKLVRVQAKLPDNADPRLSEYVQQALGNAGFLVDVGANADFILDTNLSMQDLGYQNNWQWMRGVLSVKLREREGNVERGSYQWAIKAAGSSVADAQDRIVRQVGVLLNRELRDVIVRIASH